MMSKLPQGWVECELKDFAEITMGQSPDSKFYNENGIGYPFFQGKAEFGINYPTVKKWCTHPTKFAEENSILLSVRAPVGTTNIAPIKCCIGRGLAGISGKCNIGNNFIRYLLINFEYLMHKVATGTTFKAISGENLKKIKLPLPPVNEQKRIVEKIEEEFAKINEGIEKLELIKEQIKQYKQSVLKSAFDGKLYKTTEWKYSTINDIALNIQYGYTESATFDKIGPKFLRITDIQNDFVNWKQVPYCRIEDNIKNKYLLKNGDFVFARTGATVGKSYLVTDLTEEAVYASYLIRISFKEEIFSKFVKYYFQSNEYWEQITNNQVGIGQPNVNGTKLGNLKIKLPPIIEQQKIVEEIEKRFEVADIVSATVEENLEKAKQLKQSILKKAFEGRLIPQDPTDEPASVLLAKIKAERNKK